MKQIFAFLLVCLALMGSVQAQTNRFTIQELLKVRRVGDPQVSPDGRIVAFTIGDVNKEANRVVTQIYTVSIDGGAPRAITSGAGSSSAPRWSPDGRKIAFQSGGQIYAMDADGGDKKQITKLATGAGNPVWSPDGRTIAFVSDVFPDCNGDEACNAQKETAQESSKVQAKVTDRLLYRHWTEWRNSKRTHVFIIDAKGDGAAREITQGDFDAPPYAASTNVDYAFSADNSSLAYLRNFETVEAVSTNSDVVIAPLARGGEPTNLTAINKGYDASPYFTPDGKFLIYRSQATAGFEADRWRLMALDLTTKQSRELTVGFDLQVEDVAIAPDLQTVYFTAGERASQNVYQVAMSGGRPKKLAEVGFVSDLKVTSDGKTLVFTRSTSSAPPEIGKMNVDGTGYLPLTSINTVAIRDFDLQPVESFEWTGAANAKVHGLIHKPANFDPSKKYPLFVLIHGGPQGASNDAWSYRWNAQIFASAGYIVFSPNPRGSTGYGQKFVNEISGDWGGKVTVDISNGVANLIGKKNYIDKNRIGAGGASYGGYMVNWLLGHNTDPRFRYKAFLSHAGVYNLESMYGVTEELWFTNYEFKGAPWQNPQMYARWSPHKFAANFKTPTLVTHGEIDYRVPIGEGLQLYTALQLNKVESKLIYFPDEGHWILKPQNSEFWYTNVLDWFGKHLNP